MGLKAVANSITGLDPSGMSTGNTAAQNATAINADILRYLDTASGVSVVGIPEGNFKLEWTVDVTTLYAAGVRKIILRGQGGEATRLYHSNTSPCIYFRNTSRAGAKTTVSALSLQAYNTDNYNYIDRISVVDASVFAKSDLIQFKCANYPEFATSRVVGETFRVKGVDTVSNYVWVDGRLEFDAANGTSLYAGDLHIRKLDAGISMDIYDCGFFPDGDSTDTGITTRSHTIHYEAVTQSNFYDCYFEAPWEISVRLVSCGDCSAYRCRFFKGLNNPSANQLTYGIQFYGACYNCWLVDCNVRGYRHASTTDGYSAASTTTTTPHFTTTNTSPTVTVTKTAHGMASNDYVRFAAAAATGNNITIGGAYQVTVVDANTFTITAGTNANSSSSFGGATAFTRFRENLWEQHGMPVYCGARTTHASECKGAPFDTHEEGANIQYVGCTAHNCHSGDEVSVFVGSGAQVRCRRVTIRDCNFDVCNYGISWKPGEQGTENWLKIINTDVDRLNYTSDQGRGLYVTAGTGALVNTPRAWLENCSFSECGVSIESDIAVLIEGVGVKSIRPHRGHFDLATGGLMNMAMLFWDSRSANLPGASTANRTLFGATGAGTTTFRFSDMVHVLGTDATKHTPCIFDSGDDASGKTVRLVGYKEIDPSSIGARPILEVGQESNFTVEAIICSKPRVRVHTAAGAATILAEDDILVIKKGTGAATTVNWTPITWKSQTVKDGKPDAFTNNITITPTSGNIIGGASAATFVMNANGQSATIISDGTVGLVI